jgi:hypothetical protein
MEVSKSVEVSRIEELKIVSNVRIIFRHDLNPIESFKNLRVNFELSGGIRGHINCYLILDNIDLDQSQRNYLYPLFVEAMNILIGRQLSLDEDFNHLIFKLSPPKINLMPSYLSSKMKSSVHKYELELENMSLDVIAEYMLELPN